MTAVDLKVKFGAKIIAISQSKNQAPRRLAFRETEKFGFHTWKLQKEVKPAGLEHQCHH